MRDLMEKEVDRQDRVIQGLRDEIESLTTLADKAIKKNGEQYYRIAKLEGAIEFAFNNAANSFMGVNFSFEAVKKLRAATEQESVAPYGSLDGLLAATEQEIE